ncbi:MAG: hypothetical protein COV35_00890 [Alphaproteobacteria bacterium CG11_big_fil_rev_8_21_14_0_20_39_49]|nr:MAG: hypothetical protein COV35_00890 [Alphaproteobacteria bacterium CG11_big_fil_rev_8_21_14_0_20_39_49]
MHTSAKELIQQLNQMGEATRIEAKLGSESGKSILETVCAYANEPNQDGGYILLGVTKEDNTLFPFYKAVGVENPEKIKDDLSSQCASTFSAVIRPQISEEMVDGKCILKILIPEAQATEKPVYFQKTGLPKGAYRRIGASDVKCTDEDLQLLFGNRSHKSFDQQIVEDATLEDIDANIILLYRQLREQASKTAEELSWTDEELLQSLHCTAKNAKTGEISPTVAGVLLFGKQTSLRRLFPMLRVDYIRVPGTTWVSDPENRFTTIEMRDSLLRLLMRAEAAILDDLPKAFSLPEDQLQRKDLPVVPSRVIREALVNALMHRSYKDQQPIQIIRYTNRLELRNPGYSLASEDRLGEPGSYPRNPFIAAVFHDLNLAEKKGSGIRTMMKLMETHGLTPPAFRSDRITNTFSAQLLFHHFLSEDDIKWLAQFNKLRLNDAQKKSLIFIRETGAIDNSTYRTLNKVETLEASQHLKDLRKKELIIQEPKGSATYYTLSNSINSTQPDKNSTQLKGNSTQLDIPKKISILISRLSRKPKLEKTRDVVITLCKWKELSADEIASILGKRDKKRLVRTIINPLIDSGILEPTIPESPTHPYQKYRTKKIR